MGKCNIRAFVDTLEKPTIETWDNDDNFLKSIKYGDEIYYPLPVLAQGGKDWIAAGPTASAYRPVHYFNGLTIFGDALNGGLYYSDDDCATSTKSNYTSTLPTSFMEVNGMLFFTASTGLYYSEDGKTWTKTTIISNIVRDICYGNGLWIAATTSGMYYSEDGKIWKLGNSASSFASVGFNGSNIFVAGGSANNGIWYSTDGKTWTKSTSLTDDLETSHISYGKGIWVATRDYNSTDLPGIWYSTDGKTWTKSSTDLKNYDYWNSLKFGHGVLIARSSKSIVYSVDGKTWTESDMDLDMVDFGNGLWIGCTSNASPMFLKVYISTDGINWKLVYTINTVSLLSLYIKDRIILGLYTGTNNQAVLYSENKVTPDYSVLKVNENNQWVLGDDFLPLPTFNIDDVKYEFEEGMTWYDWIGSKYNVTKEYSLMKDSNNFISISGDIYHIIWRANQPVTSNDVIVENENYTIEDNPAYSFGGGAN